MKEYIKIDYGVLEGMSTKELQDFVRLSGKRANQRLRQIEKDNQTTASNAYRYVESLDFMGDKAFTRTKKGELKFDVRANKMDRNALLHSASRIQKFLDAKTSTTKGTKNKYKKAYEELTKDMDKPLSQDEFNEYFEDGIFKVLVEMYGSEQVQTMVEKGILKSKVATILEKGGYIAKDDNGYYRITSEETPYFDELTEELEKA